MVLVAGGCWLAPEDARAGKFDHTLDLSLHGVFSVMDGDGRRLTASVDDPASSRGAEPMMLGRVQAVGVVPRVGFNLDGVRFGVGVGALALTDLQLRVAGGGADARANHAWALPLDGYLLLAPGDPRWFRLYGGVAGGATLMSVTLETHDRDIAYRRFVWGLSARVGVVLELNEYLFADLGGSVGLLGVDVFQVSAALGLPIPLSNL